MRNLRNPQLERGEVRIEDIKLNHKSRDDMPVLLGGLQFCIRRRLRATVFLHSWMSSSFPALTKRWDVRAWICGPSW